MSLAVELDRVSFAYRAGMPVLGDVSLAVRAGEFIAIAGPNGGGKTTLLRLVLGLERPHLRQSRGLRRPTGPQNPESTRIGYLPQRARVIGEAPVTVPRW